MKKAADRLSDLTKENTRLRDGVDEFEDRLKDSRAAKQQMVAELEYIKREDVLDEAGRQRPILIQSTESDLLEKLQVNEFLYEAQQARNPVPPIIEKIAQFLSMLHEAQTRADGYLGNLQKSNGLVSALRQRNMLLFSKTQMFESFKTRALIKYVMNLVEADLCYELLLDGLAFGQRELNEMMILLQRYDASEKVFVVSLSDNGLEEDCVNLLLQLIFQLPYLKKLDLRKNMFSEAGIKQLEDQMRKMEGVTGVIRTADQIVNVHSGNQLRLCIDLSNQLPKGTTGIPADFTVQMDLSMPDADPFLSTTKSIGSPWVSGQQLPSPRPGETVGGMSFSPGATARSGAHSQPVSGPGGPASPRTLARQGPTGGAGGAGALQGMVEPSSTQLKKPTASVGGPPVGLGGPGNVSQLGKRGGKDGRAANPGAKRQARRAKAAPPPALEYLPSARVQERERSDRPEKDRCPLRPISSGSRDSQRSASESHRSLKSDGSHRALRSASRDLDRTRAMARSRSLASGIDSQRSR